MFKSYIYFLFFSLVLAAPQSARSFTQRLFELRGSSVDGDWSLVATYFYQHPIQVVRRNYVSHGCTGDQYDGTYQCGNAYDTWMEQIVWAPRVRVFYYHRRQLVTSYEREAHLYAENEDGIHVIKSSALGLNSSWSDTQRHYSFYTHAQAYPLSLGLIEDQKPRISVIGRAYEGRAQIWLKTSAQPTDMVFNYRVQE